MRYRHLKRTVIAVLATVAFVLLFGLLLRFVFEAEPIRRVAIKTIENLAADYDAELEIDDLHWGLLPPSLRLEGVRLEAAGISAEVDGLRIDLGRIWLTKRTVELGTVAANGVRLSLEGLPQSSGGGGPQLKFRVRHLVLDDVEFEGVDLPGGLAVDLGGVRAAWSSENDIAKGFAEIARAHIQIGKMQPVDTALHTRFAVSDSGITFSSYRLESEGFQFKGQGRVGAGGARFDINGPLDIGWLDEFINTKGLLDGKAEVSVTLDTDANAIIQADIKARHLEAAGFSIDNAEGQIELVGKSLRGTLDRGRFHGGLIRGTYVLGEFGGRYPHSVTIDTQGTSLAGLLGNIGVESAGLAANLDASINGTWNGKSLGAGTGHADVQVHGASPGLPVDGNLEVDLTGEGFLRFNAEELSIGASRARWQGALTLGNWEPAWSITARPAVLEEIGPLVNTWVGSTILPNELSGTGELQVNLSGPFSELVINARIDAQPLTYAPIQLDRLVSDFTISSSMLRIDSARYQIADGFGEIAGGLAWGEAAGNDQLDLEITGRGIPAAAIASWIDLDQWVDAGEVSLTGDLGGPIMLPQGSWKVEFSDLALAGLTLGNASADIELADGRFSCQNLSCEEGLEGGIWWHVSGAKIGGAMGWPNMPLQALGESVVGLVGESANVTLNFDLPLSDRPTADLVAVSEKARFEVQIEPEAVELAATLEGAAEAHATLVRGDDGALRGAGEMDLTSAQTLLQHLAPTTGVPLNGTAHADFAVDWEEEALPRLEGTLTDLDLTLADQPLHLIEPAEFSISDEGFVVPGLRLRVRDDELFVRWTVDDEGQLRGNLSGTMDTLLLRFLLPDWEPAGRATAIVEILGTVEDPIFEGIAEIHKGSFRLPGTRSIISQVEGVVLLSSGDVILEGVDFRFMGGRGRAGGRIRESDDTIVLSLTGTANGLRFEVLPKLDARLTGTWRLNGPIEDLLLSGDVTVDRMALTTKEDLATMLLGWVSATGGSTSEGGLNLALHVEAEDTIDLRSPFVRLTGSASLEVTGTSNQPGLIGQVEVLEGGEATLLGNRYEIERGSLSFSNPQAIEPFIDLQASTWVQEYQISIHLAGTFERFVSTAVSTPPLSAPDIYSLLGVGYRSSGMGSSAMGLGLASSILSSELTSVLSRRGELLLPVDQVRVDPFAADSTGNPTARLSVIKQLTPSWTVILQSTLSGEREQIVVSRWYLAPGLFLEAAQHEDGSYSLDLKLRRPY